MKKLYFLSLILFCSIFYKAKASCNSGQSEVWVQITPDNFPSETSWSLRDKVTNALIDTGQILGDTFCITTNQCVVFTIYDAANDGLCCGYGNGSYRVFLNGTLVVSGGQFTSRESTTFNCAPGVSCTNPFTAIEDTMQASGPDTWYSFIPDTSGTYRIHTCALGNTCDTKLYVYPACVGITIDENNPGTIFYNDDACGLQSEIIAFLNAGTTYYIRVGDYLTSCAGQPIRWQIAYQGPVVGCTDPTACNYNPLASVSDGSCVYPPSPLCPAPDLEVVQSALETSMYVDNITASANNCYISEGCLAGYGNRRLIRFTTHIKNVGDQDYYIGSPDTVGNQFVYDGCHGHWHYEGYAEYLLYDQNFQPVQSGFKNGFCVLDLECSGGGSAKYGCGNMGITAGCGDIYGAGLSCQWIDITDVDTGRYTFIVRVNWDHSPDKLGHFEKRYDNNQALVCLHLYYDAGGFKVFDIIPNCATMVDCAGDTFGNAIMDCSNVCNGSSVRGDVNLNLAADSVDFNMYLNGIKEDSLIFRSCIDLNDDSLITVTDAARLNGCLRETAGIHHHAANYQNSHKHCEFPFNIYNPFDSVTFSLVNVDWQNKYAEISVLNTSCLLLAYEFKLKGALVDSVVNLALGNYTPDIRWSSAGHIVGISPDENSLFKQAAPLNFLRVYFSGLLDSTVCIDKVIAVVNSNYEEVLGKVGGNCFTQPSDTTVISSVPLLNADNVLIIPNPTSGKFDLFLQGTSLHGAKLEIRDAMGRIVYGYDYSDNSNRLFIDLTGNAQGVYHVLIMQNGQRLSKRLLLTQ